jgi:RNA polymerase sigma-70 factor (ECF subfamily)
VRGGDERAFRRLHRLHTDYVFRHALRLMGGADADAHDVLQESWLRAVRGLSGFAARSSFRTWLCAIATRVALEVLRARGRSLGDVDVDAALGSAPTRESGHGPAIVREAQDPTTRVDLERLLARMPDGYRTVLVLHDVEGMKHAEIAELMGITEGTAKSQLARARAWARAELGGTDDRRK